jgi:glucose/arabinose dehydrogenase
MTETRKLLGAVCAGALLLVSACAGPLADQQGAVIRVPDGYAVETVVEGLHGPTQIIEGPDDRLWVAQLAGGEDAGDGQVVAVDADGEQEVLLEGLAKPTGLAVLDGAVWVMLERDLIRAPLDGAVPGEPETVLADLPYNGRSNGTLTVTDRGTLLFDTSGALRDGEVVTDSGVLWELHPADPTEPARVATGFKHAYAHALAGGDIYTTEIGDGTYDGQVPPDEVHRVERGGDHGWPRCLGDQEPVAEHDGTADGCRETVAPVAVLPERSTPTGIAVAPWDEHTLLVALWGRAEVVQIDRDAPDVQRARPFAGGFRQPQHLLVSGDAVLVSDHATGAVHALRAAD